MTKSQACLEEDLYTNLWWHSNPLRSKSQTILTCEWTNELIVDWPEMKGGGSDSCPWVCVYVPIQIEARNKPWLSFFHSHLPAPRKLISVDEASRLIPSWCFHTVWLKYRVSSLLRSYHQVLENKQEYWWWLVMLIGLWNLIGQSIKDQTCLRFLFASMWCLGRVLSPHGRVASPWKRHQLVVQYLMVIP